MKLCAKGPQFWLAAAFLVGCGGPGNSEGTDPESQCPSDLGPVQPVSGGLSSSTSWDGRYLVEGDLGITGQLEIAPCTVVEVDPGVEITVQDGGSIRSMGAQSREVVFTSSKAGPGAGDWAGFEIYATASNNNRLQYTTVEYGADDQYGAIWLESNATLELANVTIRATTDNGLDFVNGANLTEANNLRFDDIGYYPIRIGAAAAGQLKNVTVEAADNERIWVRSGTLEDDAQWSNLSVPYELYDLTIRSELSVAAGTVVKGGPEVRIDVRCGDGFIKAIGTSDEQIVFESAKSSPAAGDWKRFDIYGDTNNTSEFRHVTLRHGSVDDHGMLWLGNGATVALSDVQIEDGDDMGIDVVNGATFAAFENVSFKNMGYYPIRIGAEAVGQITSVSASGGENDAVWVRPSRIESNTTWSALSIPYEIGDFTVDNGATWTVKDAAHLRMASGAEISIEGGSKLMMQGTSTNPITVEGTSEQSGHWASLSIYQGNSADIAYTTIRHGGSDDRYGAIWAAGNVTLDHVTFENNSCDLDEAGGTITETSSPYTACE